MTGGTVTKAKASGPHLSAWLTGDANHLSDITTQAAGDLTCGDSARYKGQSVTRLPVDLFIS